MRFESQESAGFKDEDAMEARSIPNWCIRAGPRQTVYFNPPDVTAAIVTCGGLCPGLNDVVQNIVFTLLDYGVKEENVLGIRYGLRGFYSAERKPMPLSRQFVSDIHLRGGTILGTSRGGADMKEIVHRIDLWDLNMVFVIGGNGASINVGTAVIKGMLYRAYFITSPTLRLVQVVTLPLMQCIRSAEPRTSTAV